MRDMFWFADGTVLTTLQQLQPMKCLSSWVNKLALILMRMNTSCVPAVLEICARRALCIIFVMPG